MAARRERKPGTRNAIWAKIKFDRQIVAISKVNGATAIYSDVEDIKKIGARARIKVLGWSDLPLPPENAQLGFVLTGAAEGSVQGTFRTSVGEPPHNYLIRWRMGIAAQLLEHTGLRLAEIASHVGFKMRFAFSVAFA